jgi:hypothetical protein
MRRVPSTARPFVAVLAVMLVGSCSDNVTEPTSRSAAAHIPVALATASTSSGAQFTTDKDDYMPGDTLRLAGTGWQPGDSLDIHLDEDPQNHPPLDWMVGVDESGSFQDSSYIVQESDLGVTFALTATSRATGESATVQFTDGSLSLSAPTVAPGFASVPFSPGLLTLTAANSASPAGSHTNVKVNIRAGTGNLTPTPPTLIKTVNISASIAVSTSASQTWDGTNAVPAAVAEGLYTARVFSDQAAESDNGVRKVAIVVDRTPPDISSPAVSQSSVVSGSSTDITLTGTATDPTASGVNANNYKVLSARYQLDGNPAGGTAMNAVDGNFNGQVENLTVTVPGSTVAGLSVGNHLLCMRATDAAGNAGNFTITGNPNCATLEITSADAQAPTINCTVPDQTVWYGADVTVKCTASDAGSGLQNPVDASFSLSTSVAAGTETASAATNSHQVCDNNSNCATAGPYTFKVDKKAPVFTCASPDGMWHATDASIACTASDGGSGVSPASDENFLLSTSVAAGTETDNASTNSNEISDAVGNKVTAGPISGNKVDKKAPLVSCGSADGNWHGSDVSINCTASDGGSGLANSADASFSLSTSEAAGTETDNASTGTHGVADAVGNSATAGPISGNMIDKKGPTVNLVCPATPVILGSTASASWTASDGGSLVAPGFGGGSINLVTSSVGQKTATAPLGTSHDNVLNDSPEATCTYSVIYLWDGFYQPVDNTNLNQAKAGSAIPVKFNLGGNQGLLIFASGSPSSTPVACGTIDENVDLIEETVNAGGSSLTYDNTAQQYIYVWKSDKSWAGTCRRLDVKLNDGTTHKAYFKWTK